jgi:hypothetical protein
MTFTFYPTFSVDDLRKDMPNVPVLLPASSWARRSLSTPRLPEHIQQRTTGKAADCGGFVATRIWGDYRYSPTEYVDWLTRWGPTWAATMDYCCESPLTGGRQEVVYRRQERTTEMAYHFWTTYRAAPWCWVPTIQGWEPEDYRKHARELRDLLSEMHSFYGPGSEWRVGIGTLCARASVKTINQVLRVVRAELPGMPFHLWGVKRKALETIDLANVVSSDSAAWHGMWYERRQEMTEAAQAMQISRRQYVITIQLPHYIEQVQAAVVRAPLLSCSLDLSPVRETLRAMGWTLCLRVRSRKEYVYIARRMDGKVREYYLKLSLSQVAALTSKELQAHVVALGITPSPTACTTPVWDDFPVDESEVQA